MAHDDVWDDSALVDSWNEALAEYKKYHSIHATHGNADGRLSPENQHHAKPETHPASPAESTCPPREEDANPSGQNAVATAIANGPTNTRGFPSGTLAPEVAEQLQGLRDASGAPSVIPPPEALLGSLQDDGLKKLLMSWYYAGFYTGLYQGQQKQQSQQREAR